jgi:hypothetical protein
MPIGWAECILQDELKVSESKSETHYTVCQPYILRRTQVLRVQCLKFEHGRLWLSRSDTGATTQDRLVAGSTVTVPQDSIQFIPLIEFENAKDRLQRYIPTFESTPFAFHVLQSDCVTSNLDSSSSDIP